MTSQLERRRIHLRKQLRRGRVEFDDVAEELGYKKLDEWTFKELAQGHPDPRKPGGANPEWLRRAIAEEIGRRLHGEAVLEMRKALPKAIQVLVEFLDDDENPGYKFQSAKLLLEYVAGAPQRKVEIHATSRLETLLADVVVLDDGSNAHPMIEGVVTRIKDEEEEDDDLPD